MRVLVTGAAGLLGAAIQRELQPHADVRAFDRGQLDIFDDDTVARTFAEVAPDVAINCAAYNDVDGAERNPEAALRANAFGVLALARACAATGASLVHYSSDFVFDGKSARPYTEEDAPNPVSHYGSSKLLGDWFALEQASSYVLRVESLFGRPAAAGGRRGSLGTIVDRIRAGQEVPVFVDRTVSPSYTDDVARATRQLVTERAPAGLYHCVNSGAATWAEVAAEAARLLGVPLRMKSLTLESAQLSAPRPRYCALSNRKLASAGVAMPSWRDALAEYLAQIS